MLLPLLLLAFAGGGCGPRRGAPVLVVFYTANTLAGLDRHMERLLTDRLHGVELVSVNLSPRLEESVRQAGEAVRRHRPSAAVVFGASRDALALAPLLAEAGVPHVLPASTSDQLAGITPYTHLLVPSNRTQGRRLASFASERLGVRRPVIFYMSDEYGTSVKDGVVEGLAERGVRDVFLVRAHPRSDVAVLVEGAAAVHDPDGVFVASLDPFARELATHLSVRLAGVPVLGSDATLSMAGPETSESHRRSMLGHYGAVFWFPDDALGEADAFMRRFLEQAGEWPDHFAVLLYDAIEVVARIVAIDRHRAAVQRHLAGLGREQPAAEGLSGPVHFLGDRAGLVRIGQIGADGIHPVDGRRGRSLPVGRSR